MPDPTAPNPRADHDDSWIQGKNWLTAGINRWIDRVTPKCRENIRLISRGMDERLPVLTRMQIRLHSVMCCYCQRYGEHLIFIRRLSRALPDSSGNETTPGLTTAVKERMKMLLRRELPGK